MTSANGETYNITPGMKTWPGNSPFEINAKAISIAQILSFRRSGSAALPFKISPLVKFIRDVYVILIAVWIRNEEKVIIVWNIKPNANPL